MIPEEEVVLVTSMLSKIGSIKGGSDQGVSSSQAVFKLERISGSLRNAPGQFDLRGQDGDPAFAAH